jgi:carbon starvation protein
MLITIHLARTRVPTRYSLIPGIFMIVTTLSALLWQTWTFLYSVYLYTQNDASKINANVRPPIQGNPNYVLVALGINAVFVAVGAVLFLVGLSMAIRLFRSYRTSMVEARAQAPSAADGGEPER